MAPLPGAEHRPRSGNMVADRSRAGLCILLVADLAFSAAAASAAAAVLAKPTAEEALAFMRTWPLTWGGKGASGKVIWVQPWANRTVEDIRTMTTLHPGYHVRSGQMWERGEPVGPERKALPKFVGKMHTRLDPAEYRFFTAFEKLEKFEVTHDLEDITDECLFYLGHLPQSVTALQLEMSEVVGPGIKHLQNLKNLKTLSMNLSRTLTDEALVQASGIQSLEHLSVSSSPAITGSGVKALAKLKGLKSLKIGSCSLSDASLDNFKDLAIEELDLSHTEMGWAIKYRGGGHANFTVTYAGLRSLLAPKENLPNLKRLILATDPKVRASLLTPSSLKITAQQEQQLAELRPGLEVR
jgi:hypothetical protein